MAKKNSEAGNMLSMLIIFTMIVAMFAYIIKKLNMSVFGNIVAGAYVFTFLFASDWITDLRYLWYYTITFGGLILIKVIDMTLQKSMGYR